MLRPFAHLLSRRSERLACAGCGRDFLCPMDWEPADDEHWSIDARCGACGLWHRLYVTNAQAAAWDVELDRQTEPIKRIVALGPLPTYAEAERELLDRALATTRGNKVRAARLLRISRKKLYSKIAKYGLGG